MGMTDTECSFDVIIPIYRVSPEFVQECLDSVLAQQYGNFTCWIVDGTPKEWSDYAKLHEVIDHFVSTDDRFQLIRQKPEYRGVSGARNQGIAAGNAPWIAFLDGDDWWFPENLGWVVEGLSEAHRDTVVVWTASDVFIEVESPKTGTIYRSRKVASYFEGVDILRQDLAHGYWFIMGHPPMTSQVVVRRDRFNEVEGFDEGLQMAEDTECWIRMLGSPYDLGERPTYQFFQIDAVGGHHRLGDHQTINGGLQTSASYDGTSADVANRVGAFESFTNQVRSIIGSQHPRPPKELPTELSGHADLDEDYWLWLRTASAGVGRSRFLLGNSGFDDHSVLDDDRTIWI